MKCPSCHHENAAPLNYCGRCRMAFSSFSLAVAKGRGHIYWILRRACAGSTAGFIAWFFIPFVSRLLSGGSPYMVYGLTGLLGGAFLGTVDGMVEESTPKTIRGAVIGGLGGLTGGLIFQFMRYRTDPELVPWLIFIYWGIAGAFIGTVSAWWEKRHRKLLLGMFSGFLGGGIGGYIGSSLHVFVIQMLAFDSWALRRLSEALLGGIIGLSLWSCLGAAERFFIFKRRFVGKSDHKTCDQCRGKNELSSWYCTSCGSVLQESAPPEKLNFSPYKTLEQLSEMLRFLSRLAAATGFIAGFVAFLIFIPQYAGLEQLMAVIVVVAIALLSYALQILFSALSEGVQVYIRK